LVINLHRGRADCRDFCRSKDDPAAAKPARACVLRTPSLTGSLFSPASADGPPQSQGHCKSPLRQIVYDQAD